MADSLDRKDAANGPSYGSGRPSAPHVAAMPDFPAMTVVLEALAEHVVYHAPDLRVLWANRSARASVGLALEEMAGQPCHRMWHQREASCPGCPLPEVVRTGLPREAIIRDDGRCWSIRGYPVRDAAGAVSGVVEISLDVTELVEARERLQDSEERHRALIEMAPDAIVMFEVPSGRFLMANHQAALLHGFGSVEALLGSRMSIHQFLGDPIHGALAMQKALADGRVHIEFPLKRRDGTEILVEAKTTLFHGGAGKPGRVLCFLRDLSARERVAEERRLLDGRLQQSQKLESLAILAGGIAHDFNNLLMGILGNASLALMDLPVQTPLSGSIRQIETAALRAAELTRQLLAYAGRGRFDLRTVDLSRMVAEMGALLSVTLGKNVSLQFDLDHELPPVEADAAQLRQVMMNLITNASEAIGEAPGVVRVRTSVASLDGSELAGAAEGRKLAAGRYVCVEVSDDGCGMDPGIRERIFDPFFSTKFPGRGLGLASTLGIVRGHKGAVVVESRPGAGSTFRVLFPAGSGPVAPEAPVPDVGWTGAGTVLVADDEDTVLKVSTRMLQQMGFEVLVAVDGAQAVEAFRAHAGGIVAVLLDIKMPHMDGIEARRRIREMAPSVPILLSSGYGPEEAAHRLGPDATEAFIEKPYRLSDLRQRLRGLLEGAPAAAVLAPPRGLVVS